MDYLKVLDPNLNRQDIGIGSYIWIELEAMDTPFIGTAGLIGINISIIAPHEEQHLDNGDLVYDVLNPRDNSNFNAMPWISKFEAYVTGVNFSAYLSLDQVKDVLNYCDRLTSMKAFF